MIWILLRKILFKKTSILKKRRFLFLLIEKRKQTLLQGKISVNSSFQGLQKFSFRVEFNSMQGAKLRHEITIRRETNDSNMGKNSH